MRRFLRKSADTREPLPLAMIGLRLGERALQIGLTDVPLMIALASKPGLSGRSALIVREDRDAVRAQSAAADAGILLETHVARDVFPFDNESFDVVIVHEPESRFAECVRALRVGGRLIALLPGSRAGLVARLRGGRPDTGRDAKATMTALERAGFQSVRLLADREGYLFIEGLRR